MSSTRLATRSPHVGQWTLYQITISIAQCTKIILPAARRLTHISYRISTVIQCSCFCTTDVGAFQAEPNCLSGPKSRSRDAYYGLDKKLLQ